MKRGSPPGTRRRQINALDGAVPIGCVISGGAVRPALSPVYKGSFIRNLIFGEYLPSVGEYAVASPTTYLLSRNGVDFSFVSAFPVSDPFVFAEGGEKGKTVVVGENKCAKPVGDGRYMLADFDYGVKCGVIRHGRLFAVDKLNGFRLRWSGTGGAFDWTEGAEGAGFVDIEPKYGKILKLVVYKQRVVALCEFGVAYLSAYGIAENFKLSYMDGAIGKIDGKSIAVAGNKIVFRAEGKFYAYDGIKAEKLEFPLSDDAGETAYAAGKSENYYLAADSKFLNRRVVYVIDIENLTSYIADVAATVVCAGDTVACYTGESVYALEYGGEYSVICRKTAFGARGRKFFKGVEYECDGEVRVEVKTGGKSRISAGVAGYCPVNCGGREFEMTVRSSGEIRRLTAVAEVQSDV